jgi:hypothetical protein
MTLPRVYALTRYWVSNPPAHEAMRMAWLGEMQPPQAADETTGTVPASGGDVAAFFGMQGVEGSKWVGPPPMRIADVISMAEQAKKRGLGNG